MSDVTTLSVRTFRAGTDKEAALKPLEEASEAREAWQNYSGLLTLEPMLVSSKELGELSSKELGELIGIQRDMLADELADTITACCNLAARYGIDLQDAIKRVERRNVERGRYE